MHHMLIAVLALIMILAPGAFVYFRFIRKSSSTALLAPIHDVIHGAQKDSTAVLSEVKAEAGHVISEAKSEAAHVVHDAKEEVKGLKDLKDLKDLAHDTHL